MQKQKTENILNILKSFASKEDGTYNILNNQLVEYSDGYQVSFVRPEAFELDSSKWDMITDYLADYLDSDIHIGVYCSEPEVSFHSMCRSKAIEIMEQYNQESILDWKNKSEFPDKIEKWLIMNRCFVKEMRVDYDEILKSIQ